jgi:hypothetical protein
VLQLCCYVPAVCSQTCDCCTGTQPVSVLMCMVKPVAVWRLWQHNQVPSVSAGVLCETCTDRSAVVLLVVTMLQLCLWRWQLLVRVCGNSCSSVLCQLGAGRGFCQSLHCFDMRQSCCLGTSAGPFSTWQSLVLSRAAAAFSDMDCAGFQVV